MQQRVRKPYRGQCPSSARQLPIMATLHAGHPTLFGHIIHDYEEKVKKNIDNIIINGDEKNRLPGNSNISFIGVNGQDLLLNLDMIGICVSSGSACTSGSIDASHVLIALGVKEEVAKSSIRVSIGKYNTKEEIDYLVENLIEIVKRQRKI